MYEKRRGGRGSGTQKFVSQKWPDKIFPMVNCLCSHEGHFGLGGGGVRGAASILWFSAVPIHPWLRMGVERCTRIRRRMGAWCVWGWGGGAVWVCMGVRAEPKQTAEATSEP